MSDTPTTKTNTTPAFAPPTTPNPKTASVGSTGGATGTADSDFNIRVVDFHAEDASQVFTESLKKTGFGVLVNHDIDPSLIEEVYDEWRGFLKALGEDAEQRPGLLQRLREEQKPVKTEEKNDVLLAGKRAPPSYQKPEKDPELLSKAEVVPAKHVLELIGAGERARSRSSLGSVGSRSSDDNTPTMDTSDNPAKRFPSEKKQDPMFSLKNWQKTARATDDADALLAQYFYNVVSQAGYFPKQVSETAKNATKRDLKHYFQYYPFHDNYPTVVSSRAKVMCKNMVKLGGQLLQWIDDHMDPAVKKKLKKPLLECVSAEDESTMLRILHYPAYKAGDEEPGAVRAAAHEDINLITVLPAGSSKGLQVWSDTTKKWYVAILLARRSCICKQRVLVQYVILCRWDFLLNFLPKVVEFL